MDAIIVRPNPTYMVTVDPFMDEIDDLATRFWDTHGPRVEMVPIDILQKKDELVVRADLPGFKKADLDINIEHGVLNISGSRKPEKDEEKAEHYTTERPFGSFSRSFTLPFDIDPDKVSAKLDNGVLEIRLPKSEQAKPRQIDITVK